MLFDFDDIRPYNDSEVKLAVSRVVANPTLVPVLGYLFPERNVDDIINEMLGYNTVFDFQIQLMDKVIRSIVNKTSSGLTCSGFENLDPTKKYLFVSNHRDIMLDSGILQILLHENGHETSEITFGSNLMISQFVIDLGKLNKMFTLHRGGTGRDFYNISQRLSSYLRYTINQKKQSVWIAQKNGRTKDGNDLTEPAIIKMFGISGSKNFVENFSELNIVPMSISYEIEPCDNLKVREMYLSNEGPYEKQKDEDLNSILKGITGLKGRIHLAVGKSFTNESLEPINSIKADNEKYRELARLIDQQIHLNYKLWPGNYAASDMLHENEDYKGFYSDDEKQKFEEYIARQADSIQTSGDPLLFRKMLLRLYSFPVENSRKAQQG